MIPNQPGMHHSPAQSYLQYCPCINLSVLGKLSAFHPLVYAASSDGCSQSRIAVRGDKLQGVGARDAIFLHRPT